MPPIRSQHAEVTVPPDTAPPVTRCGGHARVHLADWATARLTETLRADRDLLLVWTLHLASNAAPRPPRDVVRRLADPMTLRLDGHGVAELTSSLVRAVHPGGLR